jgi:predicted transcriptional regulator
MADTSESQNTKRLILEAIRQKNPDIKPGETFDWLIIHHRLRQTVTSDEFCSAMTALGSEGMIGADETRRWFVLTEKGFEALRHDDDDLGSPPPGASDPHAWASAYSH